MHSKKELKKPSLEIIFTDISAAIQAEVEKHGYGVVRDFAGHGIGKQMHEDPEILIMVNRARAIIAAGMAFAIEPMITMGSIMYM